MNDVTWPWTSPWLAGVWTHRFPPKLVLVRIMILVCFHEISTWTQLRKYKAMKLLTVNIENHSVTKSIQRKPCAGFDRQSLLSFEYVFAWIVGVHVTPARFQLVPNLEAVGSISANGSRRKVFYPERQRVFLSVSVCFLWAFHQRDIQA